MTLTRRARAFRTVHAAFAVVQLWALARVWVSVLTRRRGAGLPVAVALLVGEGIGLLIGRGDCPLGPFQQRLGDPVPLFELVLPRRAAKAAVPVLAIVAAVGLVGLLARPPRHETAR